MTSSWQLFAIRKDLSYSFSLFVVWTNLLQNKTAVSFLLRKEVAQNWHLIKIIWFLHHLKALNERIWKWAHFLNLAKQFWRYLNFSAPKSRTFLDKTYKEVTYLKWHQKEDFRMVFLQFSGNLNTHDFVKNDLKL